MHLLSSSYLTIVPECFCFSRGSLWTTPHCGTVVKDKYIPLLPLLLSLSPQHPDWPRLVIAGSGSGKPPQDRWIRKPAVTTATPFPFIYFLYWRVALYTLLSSSWQCEADTRLVKTSIFYLSTGLNIRISIKIKKGLCVFGSVCTEQQNLDLYAGHFAGVLLNHGCILAWTGLVSPTRLTSALKCGTWAWHTHARACARTHAYTLEPGKRVVLHRKITICFPTLVHHSWSFQSALIILWSDSPAPLRSHSTAAALLYSRPIARAIIGRRGRVAQLTRLIPRSQCSAVPF